MKILFWNVDTQKDFVNKDGKLAVENAVNIKTKLKSLTQLAKDYDVQVVNTADFHRIDDAELSKEPDFMTTFPYHCIENSEGAEFIDETKPADSANNVTINYNDAEVNVNQLYNAQNIIIRKNKFDVFEGNPYTSQVLDILGPDIVVVYGVATNVCVNCAVLGLASRGYKVVVAMDAIKELPNLDVHNIMCDWEKIGVKKASVKTVKLLVELLKEDNYGN